MTGKLSWKEDNGKVGGKKAIDVDFDKKQVSLSTGKPFSKPHGFSKDNLKEIQWVIENNIEFTKEEIKRFKYKLSIKETTYVQIDNGYKIFEPPTDKMKKIWKEKIETLKANLETFSNINITKLIK